MVNGLAQFRAHFGSYNDKYILIGGTACSIALEEADLKFRVTKDLDIVLCVEALDSGFARAFWEFVYKGRYKHQQKSSGKKLFYRFKDPADPDFPETLELFSRKPDALNIGADAHFTPIPLDDELLPEGIHRLSWSAGAARQN